MIVKESIKMESQDEYEDEEGNNSADQEEVWNFFSFNLEYLLVILLNYKIG